MRIVIVSNRLPFQVSIKDRVPRFRASAGGLTTGVWSYLERAKSSGGPADYLWVGWPGTNVEKKLKPVVTEYAQKNYKARPVFLSEESVDCFYHGFCNKTIWPLFHYFPTLVRYQGDYWKEYKQVNEAFAEALMEVLQPDDLLWVHDYQLMLLPGLIRQKMPGLPIGFFLHIPFPSWEIFRLLPREWREELIDGLLGASLLGFHTHDYTRHFLSSVLRTSGYEHHLGQLTLRDRVVKADTFPMGIDYERFASIAASHETEERVETLRKRCEGQKVIFSVDRLDYTKGLIDRLKGYDLFLRKNPEWRGKVVFVISVAPSRTGVESYQAMRLELEQTVGRIVGAHGTVHWTPLIYQYRNMSQEEIVSFYRLCDVAMVTPLRDGMNLVAKEFVASRPDRTGVLILSEMAGAVREMGEALIINPLHVEEYAGAIEQALTMSVAEQKRRIQPMQERLARYDVTRWAGDFVQTLVSTQQSEAARRARSLTGKAHTMLVQHYRSAPKRALLLDYDGTLVAFADKPRLARPDKALLSMLDELARDTANELLIVSGRSRVDLQEWFGHLPVSLSAEHGIWLRRRDADWVKLRNVTSEWKESIRPILQLFVDRLPGALLEEKEFSLAWHYRRSDPDEASLRAKDLLDDLSDYTRNVDVQVLEGNKVLEIRNTGVSKGTAAVEWLTDKQPEFILAIGDDWTDEDLFKALPPSAYSVRVGLANTAARYYLASHVAVRRLLKEFELGKTVQTNADGLILTSEAELAA